MTLGLSTYTAKQHLRLGFAKWYKSIHFVVCESNQGLQQEKRKAFHHSIFLHPSISSVQHFITLIASLFVAYLRSEMAGFGSSEVRTLIFSGENYEF
ncbi:unnamed protein product [Prunus armeniaca]